LKIKKLAVLLLALLLAGLASARVEFGLNDFTAGEFKGLDKVNEACAAPAASSFWCGRTDAELVRIPTKGVDWFFNEAGEAVAVFAKQQKGQELRNYALDNAQNLIPTGADIPGNAVLIDGEYFEPEDASGSWEAISDTEIRGEFTFRADGFDVTRTVTVSNISHSLVSVVEVTPAAAADGEDAGEHAAVQLAFPGLGRADSPVVKVGQSESHATNPISQAVDNVSYVSLQTNDRNSGYAIVMRPAGSGSSTLLSLDDGTMSERLPGSEDLGGISLGGHRIALQRELTDDAGAGARIAAEVYTGPNELVRFSQEGYADLPGLFRPNVLGRLSLGLIWLLVWIHGFAGSWGLSIILLTLVFRALIWPLISTQTKSMFAMQQIQPRVQALQKKYKDDREKLAQEQMKLYKEEGINPAGGCLPMLLQMPLFIILWRVFVNFEFNEGFLWLPDLGLADPIYILPILYVGVMFLQSYFSTKGNPQMLRQQLFINLVFVFIIVNFPSGVILYFVVSMLVQVFQYWLISKSRPAPAAAGAK